MRVIVVLLILTLALIVTVFLRKERENNFDYRFDRAEQRIKDLAAEIEDDLEEK